MPKKYSSNRGGNHPKARYRRSLKNMTSEERAKHDQDVWIGKLIVFIIVIAIGLIVVALGGKIK